MLGGRELLRVFLGGKLVEALGEALGAAAGVDEDDRRVVFLDQLQQLRVDRGPDRSLMDERLALGRDAVPVGEAGCPGFRHVLDRDDDLQVELLGDPGVDDLALATGPDQEPGDPLQRPLRRREPDPLQPGRVALALVVGAASCSRRSRVSARWEPRLLCATAWISSTITASALVRISRAPEESIR